MSRSKLTRALLAAASLLAAVPLMAQSRTPVPAVAAAPPVFPVGRYTLQALDPDHAPPAGLVIEFTTTTLNVISGGQVVETHGAAIDGEKWQIFGFGGGCAEAGDYRWHMDGGELWMELVTDPCAERAQAITTVRFIKE